MPKSAKTPEPPSQPANAPEGGWAAALLRVWGRLQRFSVDIGGLGLLALAVMTLLALLLPGSAGGLLRAWIQVLRLWFGWGSFWLAVSFGLAGLWLI